METKEKKLEFITMRAAGNSYRTIAKALNINKDTCARWNKEFSDEVERLRGEELDELFTAYGMEKTARVKRLGETLSQINKALESADFASIEPVKLLQLRLAYMNALKDEQSGGNASDGEALSEDNLTRDELQELTAKVKEGTATLKETETAARAATRFNTADTLISDAFMNQFTHIY